MSLLTSLLFAAIIGFAQAQTPTGFTPQVNTKLEVAFNTTMVATPGQQLTKAGTASQPQIALPSGMISNDETFMFVMLDLDVPPAQGSTNRRVLLHALNTGFKATQQKLNGGAVLLASTEKGPAAYLPPGPPATDTMPHRYVELLFKQPANLNVKASDFAGQQARFNFDITTFLKDKAVSAPVAANFFRVDGRANATATASGTAIRSAVRSGTGTATGTGGNARNTLAPFLGGAGQVDFSHGLAGLVGGLAFFAM
ncbi:PEBP-like protein [Cucurbitaria berberidis CBS 394.84]|uniref:PEBP-like protein n=1 Tax=Cucurbitaria berberidis CBS 394.84 TaxID=1168544 RepID=A0A9P4GM62_9PLEO|nr:PEBP-like protein [Cucurbitaria berberidis CBS 394.84]KAF1847994.1 PEBP-like protein [Cucurbitaria berberidis CBS 394.84]